VIVEWFVRVGLWVHIRRCYEYAAQRCSRCFVPRVEEEEEGGREEEEEEEEAFWTLQGVEGLMRYISQRIMVQ
jgi:hypothetical protein